MQIAGSIPAAAQLKKRGYIV